MSTPTDEVVAVREVLLENRDFLANTLPADSDYVGYDQDLEHVAALTQAAVILDSYIEGSV